MKKNNRLKELAIIIIALAVLLFPGCAAEEDAWKAATQTDTIEGYEEYLKEYPDGEYVSEANEEIAWKVASKDDSVKSYEKYLDNYPDGEYAKEAVGLIDSKLIPGSLKVVILDKATGQPVDLTKFTLFIANKGDSDELTQFEKDARKDSEIEWDRGAPGELVIKNLIPGEYSLLYFIENIFDTDILIDTISVKPDQLVDLGVIEIELNEE